MSELGPHVRIFFTMLYILLTSVALTGNLMVIVVVLWVRKMLNSTNCYLLSLAISDLLFYFVAMPVEMSYLHGHSDHYLFGSTGCQLLTYSSYLCINASALSITIFTIERYIGICHPITARNFCTVRRAVIHVIILWFLSIFYNLPWAFLAQLKEDTSNHTNVTTTSCTFAIERQSLHYKLIFGADFVAFYVVPVALYVVLYGKIMYSLGSRRNLTSANTLLRKSRSNQGRSMSQSRPSVTSLNEISTVSVNSRVGRRVERKPTTNTGRRRKALKLLALVPVVFAMCWLPYRAMVMYNSFAYDTWSPESFILFAKTMVFVSSAINPILYNFVSTRFRRSFKLLLQLMNRRLCGHRVPLSRGMSEEPTSRVPTMIDLRSRRVLEKSMVDPGCSVNLIDNVQL